MPILCATDFSPSSRSATELAVALARRLHKTLLLVHATEPPPIALPEATLGLEAWESALQEAAQTELSRVRSSFNAEGIEIETFAAVGSPPSVIGELITKRRPSLVVVGTHGRRGASRFFLGSVAERVVRSSVSPVLVVPQGAVHVREWADSRAWRLLAASDGTPAGHAALAWALGLERTLEGAITCDVTALRLFWAHQEAHHYGLELDWHQGDAPPLLLPFLERDFRQELSALGHGPKPDQREPAMVLLSASRDVVHDVLEEAATRKVDALVVGVPHVRSTRGTTLRLGPLLRAASLPVLCIPTQATPADEALPPIRAALVATDLSDDSHEAIRTAYRLMRGPGQRVELCHVVVHGSLNDGVDLPLSVPSPPMMPLPLSPTERTELEARLKALVPPAAAGLGITTNVSALEGTDAAEALLQAAARLDADLIVLAFRGHSGPRRLIFGSVAEEVARRSPRPVLLVHPR